MKNLTKLIEKSPIKNLVIVCNPQTLRAYDKYRFEKLVKAFGGITRTSVSNKTDIFVTNYPVGKQYITAKDKGISIITESEFMELINYSRLRDGSLL